MEFEKEGQASPTSDSCNFFRNLEIKGQSEGEGACFQTD